jgi:LacI family transcriptional regulator
MLCGAIFMGNLQFKQHEIKKTLDCLETPSVFMDYHMNIPNAISVTGKDKLGGRIATEHLLKLGRKKIGFVGGQMPNYCLRFEGYLQALKKHGRDFDKSIVWFDVEKACEYISANPDAIDAVFSCGDCFTIKIMNHIYRCGLRIPEDVSLVSYDDTIVLNLLSPAVTCISVDRSEMVNKVCQAVLGKMKTSQIEVETKLIIRDSASAPI